MRVYEYTCACLGCVTGEFGEACIPVTKEGMAWNGEMLYHDDDAGIYVKYAIRVQDMTCTAEMGAAKENHASGS